MSSVLEPHKVTSVLSNLVPMVTNILSSSYNVKIMSEQIHHVRSYQRSQTELQKLKLKHCPNCCEFKFLTLTEHEVPADTDMDDEAQCVNRTANLIQCDSVSLQGLF